MLPRRSRLSTEQFEAVMEKGRVYNSPPFLVRVIPVTTHAGFAAVAPKKLAPTAVLRNKIRREIYLVIESIGKTASFSPVHAIVFAKEPFLKSDAAAQITALQEIFVKAAIIK